MQLFFLINEGSYLKFKKLNKKIPIKKSNEHFLYRYISKAGVAKGKQKANVIEFNLFFFSSFFC